MVSVLYATVRPRPRVLRPRADRGFNFSEFSLSNNFFHFFQSSFQIFSLWYTDLSFQQLFPFFSIFFFRSFSLWYTDLSQLECRINQLHTVDNWNLKTGNCVICRGNKTGAVKEQGMRYLLDHDLVTWGKTGRESTSTKWTCVEKILCIWESAWCKLQYPSSFSSYRKIAI